MIKEESKEETLFTEENDEGLILNEELANNPLFKETLDMINEINNVSIPMPIKYNLNAAEFIPTSKKHENFDWVWTYENLL